MLPSQKGSLINYCGRLLNEPLIERNITSIISLEFDSSNAVSTVIIRTVFDKQGRVYQNFKHFQLTLLKFNLKRENSDWLVNRIELLKIDNQNVNWEDLGQWRWQ